MEFLNRILNILKKPFPEYESLRHYLKTVILISLFVTFFLYHFQPNGIAYLESNKFLICLGFGAICFLTCLTYEAIMVKLLKVKGGLSKFTFGKWIVQLLGLILSISVFNFLYIRLVVFGSIDWRMLPAMIYGTLSIGIFPIVALGAIALSRQERKFQSIAEEINGREVPQQVEDKSIDTIFDIQPSQFLYVEALQNYAKIGYLDDNGEVNIKTERVTMKAIEEKLIGSTIVKCHRSYLVNRSAIQSISGNAQGLVLKLSDCDKEVPVSRSYVDLFRSK